MNYEEIISDVSLQQHKRLKLHYDYDGIIDYPEYVLMNFNTRIFLSGDRTSEYLYLNGMKMVVDMTMKDGEVKVL